MVAVGVCVGLSVCCRKIVCWICLIVECIVGSANVGFLFIVFVFCDFIASRALVSSTCLASMESALSG